MNTKLCFTCKIYLPIDNFGKNKRSKDGLQGECKTCKKIYFQNYYQDNKIDIKEKSKQYKENNKEYYLNYGKIYYLENKKEFLEKCKKRYLKNKDNIIKKVSAWRKTSEKYIIARRKRKIERYNNDIIFRLKSNILSRLNLALKNNVKSARTEELLGCTITELKIYLESQFLEGMSWENRSDWHIDHIIPCNSFDLSGPDQQKKCFHYTNLQPLWAIDNIKKGCKIDSSKET